MQQANVGLQLREFEACSAIRIEQTGKVKCLPWSPKWLQELARLRDLVKLKGHVQVDLQLRHRLLSLLH